MDFMRLYLVFLGFFVSFAVFSFLIKRLAVGHKSRDFVPGGKVKKNASPIGGVCFVLSFFISIGVYWLYVGVPKVLECLILIPIFGMFAIGFLDDAVKILQNNHKGISARFKLVLQFAVATVFAYFAYIKNGGLLYVPIFFGKIVLLDIGVLWLPFSVFIMVATSNASNLTDGLDGLLGKQALALLVFSAAMICGLNGAENRGFSLDVILLFAGILIAFLVFNSNPASVFMGDSGSLMLGGLVSALFIQYGLHLLLPIVCLVFLLEAVSVIMQVYYFKFTGGKRIFRMTPIHHHFELLGYPEQKITDVAFCITVMLCAFGYYVFFAWAN